MNAGSAPYPARRGLVLRHGISRTWLVVHVIGELDVSTAPGLRRPLGALVENGHNQLILDLSQMHFMDSSGLGNLVSALKRVRVGDGRLALVGLSPRTTTILRLTGLAPIFATYATVDQVADTSAETSSTA